MNKSSNRKARPSRASHAGRATELQLRSKDRKGINQIAAPLDPLGPKLISLSEVEIEDVQWLVPDLIPLGHITVLHGPKGEGKSTMSYDLTARITSGTPMPFCDGHVVTGGAILLQAEDDLGAVRNSIESAGGNASRVRVFARKDWIHLDDPDDMQVIEAAAIEVDAKLLVADPFSEFFSKTLKDEKVIRESFRLLRTLAASSKLAVALFGHFTKMGSNALYRGLGGVAVVNAARAALVVGGDPSSDDPYRHVLAFNRGNLPRTRNLSLVYQTVKRGNAIGIEWLGESNCSADDIVAAAQNTDANSQLQEACYVLYSILTTHEGPMPATEVYSAAQEAFVSAGTLKRAKKMLKVRSRRESHNDLPAADNAVKTQWFWELPDDQNFLRPYHEQFWREQQDQSMPGKSTTPEKIADQDRDTRKKDDNRKSTGNVGEPPADGNVASTDPKAESAAAPHDASGADEGPPDQATKLKIGHYYWGVMCGLVKITGIEGDKVFGVEAFCAKNDPRDEREINPAYIEKEIPQTEYDDYAAEACVGEFIQVRDTGKAYRVEDENGQGENTILDCVDRNGQRLRIKRLDVHKYKVISEEEFEAQGIAESETRDETKAPKP